MKNRKEIFRDYNSLEIPFRFFDSKYLFTTIISVDFESLNGSALPKGNKRYIFELASI